MLCKAGKEHWKECKRDQDVSQLSNAIFISVRTFSFVHRQCQRSVQASENLSLFLDRFLIVFCLSLHAGGNNFETSCCNRNVIKLHLLAVEKQRCLSVILLHNYAKNKEKFWCNLRRQNDMALKLTDSNCTKKICCEFPFSLEIACSEHFFVLMSFDRSLHACFCLWKPTPDCYHWICLNIFLLFATSVFVWIAFKCHSLLKLFFSGVNNANWNALIGLLSLNSQVEQIQRNSFSRHKWRQAFGKFLQLSDNRNRVTRRCFS